MRKVISFRLDEPVIAEARRRAKQRKLRFTKYLEGVVLNDLESGSSKAGTPAQPSVVRVLRILRDHRGELASLGVRHASIFGSVARGEDSPDSDVDILVDVDPDVVRDIFAYSRIRRRLEEIVGRSVDIARQDRLRPRVAKEVERDGVHAF